MIYIDDHVQAAKDTITAKRRTLRVLAIVAAMTRPAQLIEDTILNLRGQLALESATGGWLDRLGRVVGERREGATDQVYRRFIAARLVINASEGSIEEILQIGRLLAERAEAYYSSAYPAGYGLLILNVAPPDTVTLARIRDRIERGTSAGVAIHLGSSAASIEDTFRLDYSAMPAPGDPGDGMGKAF